MQVGDIVIYKGKRAEIAHILNDPLHAPTFAIRIGNITKKVQKWEVQRLEVDDGLRSTDNGQV